MRVPRFLVSDMPSSGTVVLPESESHHAIKVLRMRNGEEVELFDGAGNVASGTIISVDRREVVVGIEQVRLEPNDHFGRITLAVALPKGDRQRGTIEKLTELGVDRLIPLVTTYGVAEISERNAGRIERYSVEACKQSGRNRLVVIEEPLDTTSLCERIRAAAHSGILAWVLHPPGQAEKEPDIMYRLTARFLESPPPGVLFVIGPEGGFSEEEIAEMSGAGASILSLGARILRVETAVSVACTLGSIWVGPSLH